MEIVRFTTFAPELEDVWTELLASSITRVPFLGYDYLRGWWQNRGGGEWEEASELAILVGREGGKVIGIAPCFITQHEGGRRLMFLGSIEISDFLDLIVSENNLEPFSISLTAYIHETLFAQGVEAVDFYNLLEKSPSVKALSEAARQTGFSVDRECLQYCPYIPLPGDWETYLESIDKKQRHEIRRKMRRASEGDSKVEMVFATDPTRIDQDAENFIVLMAKDPEKEAFLTAAMRRQFHDMVVEQFSKGIIQLAFLRVDGENAAAYLNFDTLNRIWVYNSGIDPRFREFSPGWVLLGHLLKWANENHREAFDFMRGDEDYKYRFGAVNRFITRLTIT